MATLNRERALQVSWDLEGLEKLTESPFEECRVLSDILWNWGPEWGTAGEAARGDAQLGARTAGKLDFGALGLVVI